VLPDESDVLSDEASEPEPAVVPAKLDAIAGPAAASSAKDNETERNFMRFPKVGGRAPRWAQTNRFQAARGLPKLQLRPGSVVGTAAKAGMKGNLKAALDQDAPDRLRGKDATASAAPLFYMEIGAGPAFKDKGIDWDTVVVPEYVLFTQVCEKIAIL
jgi:hypothetical protein